MTNKDEKNTFANLHFLAQKYGLALICQRCDHAVMGNNNDSKIQHTVECRCREWRFVK